MAAAETLARVRGTCRDLAVLFIAIRRTSGLVACFVSGYQTGAQNQQERIYARLGGGVFARSGLAVAGAHVAVEGEAGAAQPLTRYFRGENSEAELEVSVQLETDSASL